MRVGVRDLFRAIVRLFVITLVEALSLLLTDWLFAGVRIMPTGSGGVLTSAVSVAVVLAVLNILLRPLLVLLTLPLNIVTLGLFTLIINALMIWLSAFFLPYFEVSGPLVALSAALILSAVNTFITSLITIDDDYAFYDGVVQWISRQRLETPSKERHRGLLMLEIDGLSYDRMQRALELGLMPTVAKLLQAGTHALSHVDCGLPSQTSSCQAGIMYGDNYDIPAFRWYDKEQGRLFVSNNFRDAAELNRRYANGKGLLRDGTSINNLLSGEARKALLTMSVVFEGPDEVDRRSPGDMYLVFVNPYFLTRAVVLTFWDILIELTQGLRQRLRNTSPRISRLEKGYPLLRGITNIFLRDLSAYTTILDVIRGSPAIYTTFIGYDEVAHHAGPDSKDAMDTLRGFDTQLKRVLEVVERKAPRPYELFLLSDHGQSYGATFLQRYGHTLTDFIDSLLSGDADVTEVNATESAQGHAGVLLAEIAQMQTERQVGRVTGAAITRASRSLDRRLQTEVAPADMDSEVIVCVSGNLANIYFNIHAAKVTQSEIDATHPGLIPALLAHPGIGLVLAYDDDGCPWVLGSSGARDLLNGRVLRADPLAPYAVPGLRAEQLHRLAEFPHSGDLILISTLYPGGEIAAFEELIGSHGGLGGQQTDAFLLHPVEMHVPPTKNAIDVYHLLNARRDLPPPIPHSAPETAAGAWHPRVLWSGMRAWRSLFLRAARVLRLDRSVFSEVAVDPLATGQALILFTSLALFSAFADLIDPPVPDSPLINVAGELFAAFLGWSAVILLALIAGNALRAGGSFTRLFRAIAFAQVPGIISHFRFLPTVGPYLAVAGVLMVIFATWLALQEALQISRRRALLIPFVALVLVVAAAVVVTLVASGVALSVTTFFEQLRLLAQ